MVVFGLGGIGLNVIQGARMVGADKIIGVDLNPARKAMAREVRHDPFRQPERGAGRPGRRIVVDLTDGGADYSFECIGNDAADAPGAGVLPQGLGQSDHHRRRRRRRRRSRRGRSSW